MESEDRSLSKLENVLSEVDNWLVSFGHIPAHAHNRIIEELSVRVRGVSPGNIEYYVDPDNRRIDITIYFPLWKLLFMWILGQRAKKLQQIISIVEGILVGYEIRAVLARRKTYEKPNSKPTDDGVSDAKDEPSLGLLPASDLLPDQKEQSANNKDRSNELERPNPQDLKETQDS